MSKSIEKIVSMSESNRNWIINKLSLEHKSKLKEKISEKFNIHSKELALENNNIEINFIWKTEGLSLISPEKIITCLDRMPGFFVSIFLHYEGTDAEIFFINFSNNSSLSRHVSENINLKHPNMHGVTASKYFCKYIRDFYGDT